MNGFTRLLVATATGAGLGAGAALARRHLRQGNQVEDEALWSPPADVAPPTALPDEPSPTGPVAAGAAAQEQLTSPTREVGDLDAARARLRERAAALRAEMEGEAGLS